MEKYKKYVSSIYYFFLLLIYNQSINISETLCTVQWHDLGNMVDDDDNNDDNDNDNAEDVGVRSRRRRRHRRWP